MNVILKKATATTTATTTATKRTQKQKNAGRGGEGAKAIVKEWELNDFAVHLS